MTVNPNTSVTGTPFIPTVRPGAVDSAAARETSAEAASTALPVDSKAPPAEKRPTLLEAAGRGAIQTGKAWAQEVGTVTSGVGGLGLMTLGLYGGVIGGALAGSILGGGFAGPVAAALSQGGAWNFLSTGLSTVSAVGKAGMVLGGLAGAAGGWRAGAKLGEMAGKPVPFMLGMAPGAVKGAMDHLAEKSGVPVQPKAEPFREERPQVPEKVKGPVKFVGQVVGGGALLAGLAGGGAIGAGIATGAGLARGLIASNLNFTSLAGTSAIGAAVGAAIMGGICFVGGTTLVQGITKGVREVVYRFAQGREWIEQGKKEELLNGLEKDVVKSEKDLETQKAAAERNQKERAEAVAAREAEVAETRSQTADLTRNEETLVGGRSSELYDARKQELGQQEKSQDARQAHLDSENVRIGEKETKVPDLTREEATRRREAHQAQNQEAYDTRKGSLESREGDLNGQEARIETTVEEKVQAELQPLREERDRLLSGAAQDRSETSRLESQASSDRAQVPSLNSEASSLRSRASSTESDNSRLRNEVSHLRSVERSKESELQRVRREREAREAEERRRREADERRRRDESRTGSGGGRRDDSNYGGGHGRRDSSKY